jgi:hypothetical protein
MSISSIQQPRRIALHVLMHVLFFPWLHQILYQVFPWLKKASVPSNQFKKVTATTIEYTRRDLKPIAFLEMTGSRTIIRPIIWRELNN